MRNLINMRWITVFPNKRLPNWLANWLPIYFKKWQGSYTQINTYIQLWTDLCPSTWENRTMLSIVKISSWPLKLLCSKDIPWPISAHWPSTSVLTAIRASSWTPPDPAVLWNILNREAMTTSDICKASWCCTFRRTFCELYKSSGSVDSKPSNQNNVPLFFWSIKSFEILRKAKYTFYVQKLWQCKSSAIKHTF